MFPFWLAPQQVTVVPIAARHHEYALSVKAKLNTAGFRAEVDRRNEKMGKRIREAELQKVPVMLVCGDRDVENSTVSVRRRGEGDLGAKTIDETLAYFAELREAPAS